MRNLPSRWWKMVLAIAISAPSTIVFAQGDAVMEEVVVTGSRIARNAETYVGPMTVVTSEQIQLTGSSDLIEALQDMPSVGLNSLSRNDSNAGRGFQTVEIHGLSEERTLVLRNGRRMPSSFNSSSDIAVDLRNIPSSMVERVELLADGASAVYGSDAIAGVVNVILKNDFEGLQFTGKFGDSSEGGGEQSDLGVIVGGNFDRGNLTFAVEYTDREEVEFFDRDWAEVPILAVLGPGQQLIGSGIPPDGRYSSADGSQDLIFRADPATGASFQNYSTFDQSLGHRFNYNGDGVSLINEDQRISAMLSGYYNITDTTRFFIEGAYTQADGTLDFPGLPVSGAHGRFTDMIPVPFTNPFIPADALPLIQAAEAADPNDPDPLSFQMAWRAQDAGQRIFPHQSNFFQTTLGVDGQINDAWTFEGFYTHARSETISRTRNQVNVNKLRIAVDPARCAAEPECPEVADIFGRGDITRAVADFILFTDRDEGIYEMDHYAVNIAGSFGELPGGPIGVSFGAEYREEEGDFIVSGVTQAGDGGGNFAENTDGEYDVTEFYVEGQLPLLADAPLAHELTIEGAVRYSDYSTFGDETTYKGSIQWAPFQDLRFRGVVSTAYRAPNIGELFSGMQDSFRQIADPCSGYATSGNATLIANCAADGVPAPYIQNAGQLKVSEGGNPNLIAETADNVTVGLVYSPSWLENASLTVDWFNVEIEDAVETPNDQQVINTCYNTPGLANTECSRIGRNATGQVVRFDLLNENLATIETSGVDVTAAYAFDLADGFFSIDFLASYIDEYSQTTIDGVETNFAGLVAGTINNFAGYPRWRSNTTFAYARDDWSLSLSHKYLDSMKIFKTFGFDTIEEADAVHYFDLAGTYDMEHYRFVVGIDNVTDQEPEFIPEISTNTSVIYDWVGRFYFASVTVTL